MCWFGKLGQTSNSNVERGQLHGKTTEATLTVNLFFALARICSALRLRDAVEYVDSLL